MKSQSRLTDISIRNLKPRTRIVRGEAVKVGYSIPDPGARGLYVQVFPSGKISYCVRYRFGRANNGGSRPRKLTLQAGISLAAARKMAADAMHEVAQGRDPAEAKKAQKAKAVSAAVNTLEAVAAEYLKREGGKLRTALMREQTLKRLVFPTLGTRQIDSVKRSDIVRLLDKIEDDNGSRQADLVLAYLRKIMGWHSTRDDEFRSPIIRGMGRYNIKDHARDRVLNDDELRKLWKAAEADDYFGAVVKFLLLTGARRSEAAGLKWNEIENGVWTLPAARNKTKVDLIRPLSKAALAIVEGQERLGDFVFGADGRTPHGFSRVKRDFFDKHGIGGVRVHDLRRTARTLLSSCVDKDIAERCLGHVIGGVRGTYDRYSYLPEMTVAFEKLSAQIERVVNPPAGSVVPMRKRKRTP